MQVEKFGDAVFMKIPQSDGTYKEVSYNELHTDVSVSVYSPYDDSIWFFGAGTDPGKQNPLTGEVSPISAGGGFETVDSTAGAYSMTYSLHNHRVYRGYNRINVMSVEDSILLGSYKVGLSNATTASDSYYNRGAAVPWAHGATTGGNIAAAYCDYDKCIYYFGSANSSWSSASVVLKGKFPT